MLPAVTVEIARTGVIRCGRTTSGKTICTAAITASVIPMARTVRRIIRPTSTPSTNANAA